MNLTACTYGAALAPKGGSAGESSPADTPPQFQILPGEAIHFEPSTIRQTWHLSPLQGG